MTYDHWKTTDPADEWLESCPQSDDELVRPLHWVMPYTKRWFRHADGSVQALRPGDLFTDFKAIFGVYWDCYDPTNVDDEDEDYLPF